MRIDSLKENRTITDSKSMPESAMLKSYILKYRNVVIMPIIVIIMIMVMTVVMTGHADAATYYWKKDSGTNVGGVTTDWSQSCGTQIDDTRKETLMTTSLPNCSNTEQREKGNSPQEMMWMIKDTSYPADYVVTGISVQARGEDRDGGADLRYTLGYVTGGTFSPLTGCSGSCQVTQSWSGTNTYTTNLSSLSGTAPSGSHLALKVEKVNGGGNEFRLYLGTSNSNTLELQVTETPACVPDGTITVSSSIPDKNGASVDVCPPDVSLVGVTNVKYQVTEGTVSTISHVASSPVASTTGSPLTINKPAGTVVNDVMIAVITTKDSDTYPSIPAGWAVVPNTQVEDPDNDFGQPDTRSTVAWKRAGASEPASYNFTNDGDMIGAISTFRGVIESGSPIDASSGLTDGSTNSTVTATSITTTVADAMVLFTSHVGDGYTHNPGTWTATDPASFTEAFDGNDSVGNDRAVALAYALKSSAGATGTGTVTISSTDVAKIGALIALKPSAGIVRHGPSSQCSSIDTTGWGDGATFTLEVTGDDDTCLTPLTPDSDTFVWNSCTNSSTLSLNVGSPVTGPTTITATGTATGIDVRWREDGGLWSGWVANGSTYTPTTCTTGTVDFEAKGDDATCGADAITDSDYGGAFDTLDKDPSTISIPASQTAYGDPYDAEQLLQTTGDVGSFEYKVTTAGAPTPVNWGDTTNNGTTTNVSFARAMGGTSPNEDSMILKSVSIYVGNTHNSQIRLGVYSGGNLSTGPDGATRLCDGNITSGNGTNQWLTLTCADTAIPKNTPLWIAFKGNDSNFAVRYSTNSGDGGDFQTARGRFNSTAVSTSESTSYPVTWPADGGTFADFWYSAYLTYESGAGEATCTNWTAGTIPATTGNGSLCGDYVETADTYTLYARGTDPDCGDPVTSVPVSRAFTWNSCSDTNSSSVSIVSPPDSSFVSGTVNITSTRINANTPVEYRIDGGVWTPAATGWDSLTTHPGSSTTPVTGVTVEVRAVEDECGYYVYDTVSVTVDNRVCTRQDPSITFIPAAANVPSGGSRTYAVRINNNDTPTCADATSFDYSLGTETGDTGSFDPTFFTDASVSVAASSFIDIPGGLTHNAKLASVDGETLNSPVNIAAAGPRNPVSASVTSTVANYMVHNSARFPANLFNQYHGGDWGVTASSKYGKFECDTCHMKDAANIKRVKSIISTPDGSDWDSSGSPDVVVTFDRTTSPAATGFSLADTANHVTSQAVCEVCHDATEYHRYNEDGIGAHESTLTTTDCIYCHKHNQGFRPFATCLSCHSLPVGGRAVISDNFNGSSHHVQGVTLTDQHCYACHWESDDQGRATAYHGGPGSPGAVVDLVTNWTTTRPVTYSGNNVQYNEATQTRAEFGKLNTHCLGCHDDNSKTATPFGDGKTPVQYAWDGESIAARYSQAGTTTWGKYNDADTADKNITKAYSAHGNAGNNAQGFNTTTGVDGVIPDRTSNVNVLCFDCHNSHGSTVTGIATSYDGAHPLGKGGILKDTTGGQGNYSVSYKPVDFDGSSTLTAHKAGAGICFDCHMTAAGGGTLPWGYNSTYNATDRIISYWDKIGWEGAPGVNSAGPQIRYPFKDNLGTVGGHFGGASSPLASTPSGTIGGLCTPCHDPHGVSPTLTDQSFGVPLLKGTWLTSPYKEDTPPTIINERRGGGDRQNAFEIGSPVPRAFNIDQTTFRSPTNATHHVFSRYNVGASGAGDRIMQDANTFGGLCLSCHAKSQIDPDTDNTWATYDRIHDAVLGWASSTGNNANNLMHGYSCSKCHIPHNGCLPRLTVTNCLDDKHRDQVVSGGSFSQQTFDNGDGGGQGRGPAGGGGWGKKPIPSGWPDDGGGSYIFGSSGTSGDFTPAYPTCHDTQTVWPDQKWNNVTQW